MSSATLAVLQSTHVRTANAFETNMLSKAKFGVRCSLRTVCSLLE